MLTIENLVLIGLAIILVVIIVLFTVFIITKRRKAKILFGETENHGDPSKEKAKSEIISIKASDTKSKDDLAVSPEDISTLQIAKEQFIPGGDLQTGEPSSKLTIPTVDEELEVNKKSVDETKHVDDIGQDTKEASLITLDVEKHQELTIKATAVEIMVEQPTNIDFPSDGEKYQEIAVKAPDEEIYVVQPPIVDVTLKRKKGTKKNKKTGPIPPDQRGGRPRTPFPTHRGFGEREPIIRPPEPDLVCRNVGRVWILSVEIPEILREVTGLVVSQNNIPLVEDRHEGYWNIIQAVGEITVRWNERDSIKESKIQLGYEPYLLFKISSQNQNYGRLVKSPAYGWYLTVVPDYLSRDEDIGGPVQVSQETVSIDGYLGYFFFLEKGIREKIGFKKPEGDLILLENINERFELLGKRICDANTNIGPLFGVENPIIRASSDQVWNDTALIVIGEEGGGRGKWRTAFVPQPEGVDQYLTGKVSPKRDGWYFLRFYDINNYLIDSLDYRLIEGLSDIKILQPSPFPSDDKHEDVLINLYHTKNIVITPVDDKSNIIPINSQENLTTITIPPNVNFDQTIWQIGSKGRHNLRVILLVERLWWGLGTENTPPDQWVDRLLSVTCDDFIATSKNTLWIKLPRRGWVDSINVGFTRTNARFYPVKVTNKEISIPLRDFGDCEEIRDLERDQFLNVWLDHENEETVGTILMIPASKGPIQQIGHGKKEKAKATAVLRYGNGSVTVNGKLPTVYFSRSQAKAREYYLRLMNRIESNGFLNGIELAIEVTGSSPQSIQQPRATAHAIASVLIKFNPLWKPILIEFLGPKVKK